MTLVSRIAPPLTRGCRGRTSLSWPSGLSRTSCGAHSLSGFESSGEDGPVDDEEEHLEGVAPDLKV